MRQIFKLKQSDPVAWCENNITLDYGKFDRTRHPLLLEPLRAAAQMRGGIVGLIGSVQHIKTLTAQLWHLYEAQVSPGRAAHYDLTKDALDSFSDDKFTPLVDNTEAILGLIPDQRHRKTKYNISMPYGFIRLLSIGVLSNRNSKTLEKAALDEAWAYASEKDGGNWIEQIRDRMTSYPWTWRLFIPSSGQSAESELDQLWKRSTRRVWHVPCDHCGELIPYIWTPDPIDGKIPHGGMRFASGDDIRTDSGEIDWRTLRASVYYECPSCAGRMDYDAGSIAKRNNAGRYLATNPDGDPKLDFYNYNALAHYPWSDLVEQWQHAALARARGDIKPLENFMRKRLAIAWDEGQHVSTGTPPPAAANYKLGEPWSDSEFIFATVDVQQDHYYLVIRGWAMIGEQLHSRLLERRKLIADTQIEDLCKKWNIPQGGIDPSIGCRVFLDGNYNTAQVRKLCAAHGWMMLRGDDMKMVRHRDGIFRIYGPIQHIVADEGTAQANTQRFVGQFFFSNLEARNRLALLRSIRDPDPIWTYASDAGPEYEKQLNAWVRIAKIKKRDGSRYYDWIKRGHDDHYHDCEKMQIVCAAMAGLIGSSDHRDHQDPQSPDHHKDPPA